MKASRLPELETFLLGFKIYDDQFRFSFDRGLPAMDSYRKDLSQDAFISFRSLKMAMIFKLAWEECQKATIQDFKVIMPILRRVMPTLIAQDIIGVQPMTGPINAMHTLRVNYGPGIPPAPSPSTPIPKNDSED